LQVIVAPRGALTWRLRVLIVLKKAVRSLFCHGHRSIAIASLRWIDRLAVCRAVKEAI
jgi:hypothetical protein